MKRSSWLGVLAVLMLGVGCGQTQALETLKDRKLRIDFGPGSISTTPAPAGRYLLVFSLLEPGPEVSRCTSLSTDVVAAVNGDSNVGLDAGGCSTASSSPMFTYEMEPGTAIQDATIVLSDSTHRMEVQVENLLAAYRLQSRKAELDPSLTQEGANPVTRGEIMSFDRIPDLRAVAHFDATLSQERLRENEQYGQTYYDRIYYEVNPALNQAEVQVTIPTQVEDGMAFLKVQVTENPTVLRCEGVGSCEAEVSSLIESTVTVMP